MTKDEAFLKKQREMSDDQLIKLCDLAVIKMCRTGGESFTMCVPVQVDDTDMILSELIRRFKEVNQKLEEMKTNTNEILKRI